MSYIVVGRFRTEGEKITPDWRDKLGLCILSERNGSVTVSVRGDHFKTAEITKQLCDDLIAAGIYEFEIGHSY